VNPFDAFCRDDDEMVFEFLHRMGLQKGNKQIQHIPCRCWIHFQPDHSRMPAQREHNPIAEMPIKSNKNPLLIDSLPENLSVIRSGLAEL